MISKKTSSLIRALAFKKYREKHLLFIAEGRKVVGEFLDEGYKPQVLLLVPKLQLEWEEKLAALSDDVLVLCDDKELKEVSSLSTPDQVLALFPLQKSRSPYKAERVVVLDKLNDPGNVGTILRLCDWFAIPRVYITTGTADPFQPKAVQASMGSLARVEVKPYSKDELEEYTYYAAVLEDGNKIKDLPWDTRAALVIGSESHGISEELLKQCQLRVTIAAMGKAESLNAAVAAGILIHAMTKVPS